MFVVLGIVLLVAGAITTFAVDRQAEGIDLATAGWLMMAGGGLSLIVAAVLGARDLADRRTRVRHERLVSTDGRHVVEDVQEVSAA